MNTNVSVIALTPVFRLSYPALIEPKAYMEEGKPKGKPEFSVEMLITGEQLDKFQVLDDATGELSYVHIEQLALKLSKEKWGGDFNPAQAVQHGGMKWPVRKGDDIIAAKDPAKRDRFDHYAGNRVLRAKCASEINGEPNAPRLTYTDGAGNTVTINRTVDESKAKAGSLFYPGAYGYAEVNIKPTEVDGRKYITIYLNKIHFVRDGTRIGAASLMDRFTGIHGGQTDFDATEGMGDEIP